jgi:hypothetical protein
MPASSASSRSAASAGLARFNGALDQLHAGGWMAKDQYFCGLPIVRSTTGHAFATNMAATI